MAGTALFNESLPWFQRSSAIFPHKYFLLCSHTVTFFLCFSCAHTNNNLYRDWCVELAQGSEYYAGIIQYLLLIRYGFESSDLDLRIFCAFLLLGTFSDTVVHFIDFFLKTVYESFRNTVGIGTDKLKILSLWLPTQPLNQ